jgi:Phage portal protein
MAAIPDNYKRRPKRPASLGDAADGERAGPAGYGMGASWTGGPLYADRYGAKRGPTPWQLIEAHKQVAFACGEFNALGLAQLSLRLYCTSAGGGQKPRSLSNPIPVRGWDFERLRTLPYVVRSFGADVDDVREITRHPILDSLDNPAQDPKTGLKYFDRPTLIATLVRYLDTVGIAYLKPENEIGIGQQDLIKAKVVPPLLWPLQSQYVWPVREPDSALIQSFKYFTKDYEPGDLMYIRMRPSLRDPYGAGYAALQASWQYAGLEDATVSMWDQLMGTGARPNLIVSPMDPNMPIGDDERRRLSAELNTFHAGGRAGRSLVTGWPMNFTPITYPGWDLGELKVNEYQVERIANCYGVPMPYLTRESNLANMQAARTMHAVFGLEPRAQCLASALTTLIQAYDPRLFFAFDSAIPEDEELRAKLDDMGLKNGRYTINEVNVDTPFGKKDYGDEAWMPGTLVQPTMAAERHEQGLESAKVADKAASAKPNPKPGDRGQRAGGDRRDPAPPAPGRDVGHNSAREGAILAQAKRILKRLERELKR